MSGDALTVALDLLRAPGLRAALRQRPLPADVGELIELASGEPGRLARVAASRAEAPERMLEAARFYIREVLLFAGADAYRVLGVAPGAPAEQIKLHHRLLQHWLHPDRRGNEWESAFATRINAAWGELRSPQRRAAYDGRQPEGAEGSRRMLVNQWRPAPLQERRSFGWIVVGASAAVCAWLLVLVDRQATAPAPEWNPSGADAAGPALDSIAGSVQQALENAGVLAQPQPRPGAVLRGGQTATERDRGLPQAAVVAQRQARAARPAAAAARPLPAPMSARMSAPARPVTNPPVDRPAYTRWVEDATGRATLPSTPAPSHLPSKATARVAASPAAVNAAAAAAAVEPADDAAALVERVGLLRRRGKELTRYLAGASGAVPPIWRSVVVQDQALALRTRLGSARVSFSEPAWRLTAERASMTTRTQRGSTPLELRAEFVWRNDMWLVETLHTEDLQ